MGNIEVAITEEHLLAIGFLDYTAGGDTPKIIDAFNGKMCTALTCPYPVKTPFTVTAKVPVPAVLPDPYTITVGILNPNNLKEVDIGCSFATIGSKVPATPHKFDAAILSSLIIK